MRKTAYALAMLFLSSTTVKQQGTIEFPRIGTVTIRASLPMNSFPRVSFFDRKGKLLLSQRIGADDALLFRANPSENEDGGENPTIRFKQVPGPDARQPVVLVAAMFHGGSDCAYQGTLVGEHNGHLQSYLNKQVSNSAEGGMYVGDLGGGRGYGLAVWNFIWDFKTESHVDPHRYRIQLYRFQQNTATMQLFFNHETAGKYDDTGPALAEFGLKYPDVLRTVPGFDC